jgi:stress response protein SCP2
MAVINLTKGQKINLSKDHASLKKLEVGMGWQESKGSSIDLDTSVIMFAGNTVKEVVSFSNLNSRDGSIHHHGDDLTGGGSANKPNEIIDVTLAKVSSDIDKLGFILNIYGCASSKQTFGNLKNSWVALYDADTKVELARFKLDTDDQLSDKTAMIIGEVYRHNGEWKFNSLGQATYDKSIADVKNNWGSPVSERPRTAQSTGGGTGFLGRLRGLIS